MPLNLQESAPVLSLPYRVHAKCLFPNDLQAICSPPSIHTRDFPYDIKLMILDYISLPSDLRALSLVSKEWHATAAPRLFVDIILDETEPEQVVRFLQSAQRNSENLREVRSLTLIGGAELDQTEALAVRSASLFHKPSTFEFDAAQRRRVITELLGTLPQDCLHTFRYLGPVGVRDSWIYPLVETQTMLKNLYLRCDSALKIQTSVRTLALTFANKTSFLETFPLLHKQHPHLSRLHLAFENVYSITDGSWQPIDDFLDRRDELNASSGSSPVGFLKVEEFVSSSLSGLRLDLLTIFRAFDMSVLQRLTLRDTEWGVELEPLCHFFTVQKPSALRHLAIIDQSRDMDVTSLSALFCVIYVSPALRSLHICTEGWIIEGKWFIDRLPNPCLLESFSAHDPKQWVMDIDALEVPWDEQRSTDPWFPRQLFSQPGELESLFRKMPKLRQVGLHITYDDDFSPAPGLAWQDHLHLVPNLRILHFRYRTLTRKPGGYVRSEAEIAALLHAKATEVFQRLDATRVCQHFDVLVWGQACLPVHNRAYPRYGRENPSYLTHRERYPEKEGPVWPTERLKQHIFVRQRTYCDDKTGGVSTAVQVSRARLRDLYPELDLLDYDPGSQVFYGMTAAGLDMTTIYKNGSVD